MTEYDELAGEDQFGAEQGEYLLYPKWPIPETRIEVRMFQALDVECTYQCIGSEERDYSGWMKSGPEIVVTKDNPEFEQTRGIQVATIRVDDNSDDENPKYINFWIRTYRNNQGRIVCEVSTNVCDRTVKKSVTAGAWREC